MGSSLVSTEGGTYARGKNGWDLLSAELKNIRIFDESSRDGRWLYAAPGEVGWLRATGQGVAIERFAAPALDNPYNFETEPDGSIWIEQGNARLIRLRVTDGKPTVEPFGRDAGIPEGWAQVFSLDGRVNFSVGGEILRFVEATRRFEPDEQFARDFPGISNITGRPIRDALGRVWITADGSVHVLEGERGNWRDLHEPMPPGFAPYLFYCEKGGVVWMHSARRLVRFDPSMQPAPAIPFRALFSHLNFITSGRTVFPAATDLPPLDLAHLIRAADLDALIYLDIGLDPRQCRDLSGMVHPHLDHRYLVLSFQPK